MGKKNVSLIKTTTRSKKLLNMSFYPRCNVMYLPTNMNTLMRISVHPLSSKYSLVDTRMLGDVMHGSEPELTLHCVCVCVVWAPCV